jgi:hypothetical protein
MTTTDAVKFSEIMQYLNICFPEHQVDRHTVQVYFDALSDYDVEDLRKAAKAYVKKGAKFPYVSDLVSHLCCT